MARQKKDKPPKQKKPGLTERVRRGAQAVGELGSDVVHQPKVIPGKAHGWFRHWMGKIWRLRGGGLYACGFLVTFIHLEITTIVGDIAESDGVVDFVTSELFEFVFRFFADSFINTIHAFMWPVHVASLAPPWGAVGLGIGFIVFDRVIKKPVEDYLFQNEAMDQADA